MNTGRGSGPSAEQLRYARILDYAMRAGLAVLVASFAVYVAGVLPAQVPFEALPRLWVLPAGEYLRESGMPTGWAWLAMLDRGDVLLFSGVAILAGASLPCLFALVPAYAARKDWAYLGITFALIGVLLLAASGVFGSP